MRSDVTAACRWLVQCTSQPEANARAGEKDGSDPILTRTPLATAYAAHFVRGICHFAERLDGTGKM